MCIMAPFRNLLKYGSNNGSFHIFLRSINEQNYSNYHVYMIDDASSDNSSAVILKELVKYPRLNNRITILRN
jgi:glycosyltransferase involved in cell wall biosynthesis